MKLGDSIYGPCLHGHNLVQHCPVSTRLAAWYFESKARWASYANHIVMPTSGIPRKSEEVTTS